MAFSILQGLVYFFYIAEPVIWEFNTPDSYNDWQPNAHINNVSIENGILQGETIDWDPQLLNRNIDLSATPYQYVSIRLKTSRGGTGELFWSGELTGEYGGLTASKRTQFVVPDDNEWHEIVIFPFWHSEGKIRQLRLDLFPNISFKIDWIKIDSWAQTIEPCEKYDWEESEIKTTWWTYPNIPETFAPPLNISVDKKLWVTIKARATKNTPLSFIWASGKTSGLHEKTFLLRGDGHVHFYNLDLGGIHAWQSPIVAIGFRKPSDTDLEVNYVGISEEPQGDADAEVTYFQFVNAPNRSKMPCEVMLRITNHGANPATVDKIKLESSASLRILDSPFDFLPIKINFNEYQDFVFKIESQNAGTFKVIAQIFGEGVPKSAETLLTFSEPICVKPSDYVPIPKPVPTTIEICAYYFPGWDAAPKWECIRRIAPIRKPVLGYYDESNPECVDWQIKWAVENGISCFLVDWYWVQGKQQLTHWFEAYRRARYRDFLKVAIMWANHNPPDTHSAEDWQAVSKEWIENYFTLPSYYHLFGKPTVFIWNPHGLRRDLEKRGEQVADCLKMSQEMAKQNGFEGISFIAMGYDFSKSHIERLLAEGYCGITTYHEWGKSTPTSGLRLMQYEEVVKNAPNAWKEKHAAAGKLVYFPVVDTGWDSRPWHGEEALVIENRTPELFKELLKSAAIFLQEHPKPLLVLGPINEWGEGSYIEPCTEFGFDMLQQIRAVFGIGDPSTWPVNIAPIDIGKNPYDLPLAPLISTWTFDTEPTEWHPIMNVNHFNIEQGNLRFQTITDDGAIGITVNNLPAKKFSHIFIRMAVKPETPHHQVTGQFFWSVNGRAITEQTSIPFSVISDGTFHEYILPLANHFQWRGTVTALRFDPCDIPASEVMIDEIKLLPKEEMEQY